MYCAYFAAILSVTFSPPPAIHSGDAVGLQRPGRDDGAVDLIVLALEADLAVPPGVTHDLHALVESAQPYSGRREAVAVGRHSCSYQPPPMPI